MEAGEEVGEVAEDGVAGGEGDFAGVEVAGEAGDGVVGFGFEVEDGGVIGGDAGLVDFGDGGAGEEGAEGDARGGHIWIVSRAARIVPFSPRVVPL